MQLRKWEKATGRWRTRPVECGRVTHIAAGSKGFDIDRREKKGKVGGSTKQQSSVSTLLNFLGFTC